MSSTLAPTNGGIPKLREVVMVHISKVRPFKNQPRKWFDPVKLQELAASIKDKGQQVPGLVRRLNPPENGIEFELIAGERRVRALELNGLNYFRAEVDTEAVNEKDQFVKSVIENCGREDLAPLETAHAIKRLKEDFMFTDEQTAGLLVKSRGYVTQYYSLFKLHPDVLKMLDPALPEQNQLKLSIAVRLTEIPRDEQYKYAAEITGKRMKISVARRFIDAGLRSSGVIISSSPSTGNTVTSRMPSLTPHPSPVVPVAVNHNRQAEKDFIAISGLLSRTAEDMKIYSGMPQGHIEIMLKRNDMQESMALLTSIEDFVTAANNLKAKVEEGIKKVVTSKSPPAPPAT